LTDVAIVFTPVIGQNSAALRERVCRGAPWLGVELDVAANNAGAARISLCWQKRNSLGSAHRKMAREGNITFAFLDETEAASIAGSCRAL
jgi:acetate kinase